MLVLFFSTAIFLFFGGGKERREGEGEGEGEGDFWGLVHVLSLMCLASCMLISICKPPQLGFVIGPRLPLFQPKRNCMHLIFCSFC